jgi:hypothetical protein
MATKRGPKVEPKEINKYKVVVEELKEKLMTEEQIVAQEEFINETGETPEEIKESLEKFHNVDADKEFEEVVDKWKESGLLEGLEGNMNPEVSKVFESEPIQAIKFDFQEEYKLTHNGKDAVIDALPQSQKRKKTVGELNQSELRLYHKTGCLPEI